MKKLKLLSLLMLLLMGITQVWGAEGDVVVAINPCSLAGSSTGYSTYSNSDWAANVCNNAAFGTNAKTNNNDKLKLSNNSSLSSRNGAIASAIATYLSSTFTDETQYVAALIGLKNLANVGKVRITYGDTNGGVPNDVWVLASTDAGVSYSVAGHSSSISSGLEIEFSTIESAQYALVFKRTAAFGLKSTPTFTFYEGATGGTPQTDVCADPTFDPEDGLTFYGESQSVELACTTEGATIRYTLTGAEPDENSTEYTQAISLTETTTIKAIAMKDGLTSSQIVSATYTKGESVASYNIDFETNAKAPYINWTFDDNFAITTGTITAHAGSYYGTNDGKQTASVTTSAKVNPGTLTFYMSKLSDNANAAKWKVQVSTDGSVWTNVQNFDVAATTKGEWTNCEVDLSSYSNVYVRIAYDGNTAKRAIDDISLTTITKYAVNITDPTGGTLVVKDGDDAITSGDLFVKDKTLTVVATPDEDHTGGTVYVDGVELSGTTITVPTNDITVTATFEEKTCDKLVAPTLDAVTKDHNSATIAWNTVTDAESYLLNVTEHEGDAVLTNESVSGLSKALTGLKPETQYDYTVMAVGDGSAKCDAGNNLLQGNFTTDAEPVFTVNFVTGTTATQEPIAENKRGDGITIPNNPVLSDVCETEGWTFAGWATEAVGTKTTTVPAKLYQKDETYTPNADNETLYAVYKITEAGETPVTKYIRTGLANIENGDVVIITEGDTYAMSNNNGTSNPPSAVAITVADNMITTEEVSNLLWTLTKDNGNLSFTVYGGTAKLYCTNTNNGVRVGTNDNNVFTLETSGYLKNTGTSRYVGVYTDQLDWRCYTGTSGNISGQTFAFFKATEVTPTTTSYFSAPNCCTKYTISIANGIQNGTVEANLAQACEGTTVTMTFTPATNYHLDSWSVNSTAQNVNNTTFSMPAANATVSATFVHDDCVNLAEPTLNGEIVKTYNSATLAWNEVADAEEYAVSVVRHSDNESIFSGNVNALSKALTDLDPETQYDYSIMAVGDGTDYCAEGNSVLEGNFTTSALPAVKLTLMVGGSEDTNLSGNHTITIPFNLPDNASVSGCPKTFVGWSADADRATAPEYAPGAEYTFADETPATLYAVFADLAKEGDISYVKTALGEIASGSVVIITEGDEYAMSNNNGTSNPPSAVAISVEDNKITTENVSNLLWTLTKAGDNLSFTVYGGTDKLYCTTTNNGVRVGTNSNDAFSLHTSGYLKNNGASRYLGVYSSQDWRCYTSTTEQNIAGQTFAFYKKVTSNAEYENYSTACEACKTVTLSAADVENGSIKLQVNSKNVESVTTCEAASVAVVATPAKGYELSTVNLDGTAAAKATYEDNVISIQVGAEGALTATAVFAQKNYTVALSQDPAIEATLTGATEEAHYNATINLSATDIPTGYAFVNWTSEDVEITNATSATEASFTMPDKNVAVTANFGAVYTVTFNVAGSTDAVAAMTQASVGANITLPSAPAPSETCVNEGWSFAGWATAAVAPETDAVQTLLTGAYKPTANIELFAVYSRVEAGEEPAETQYVKTNYADLVSGDVVVITSDNGSLYAMSNDNGTTSAPAAVAVTDAEGVLDVTNKTNIFWTITKEGDNLSFATTQEGNAKLDCYANNNGLRVGNNEHRAFSIVDEYLYNNDEGRYIGVYNSQDWRSYTTIHENIKNQTLAFYKAVDGSTTYYWSAPVCCTKYDITIATGIENGSVSADLEKACENTEVTLTANPAAKYHLDAWSVSYNDGENDQTVQVTNNKFNMPAFNVTVSATFAHDNCENLAAPTQNEVTKTYNTASIAWAEVTNASSYFVTVTKEGAEEPIFSGSVEALSKALSDLEPTTKYNYSVMAVGDGVDFCADNNELLEGNFTTEAAPVYTVKFSTGANNPTQADIAEDVRGEGITIPEGPTPVCDGWAFAGWATAAVETQTTEAPAMLYQKNETYIPNEDNETLYAVYSAEVASSGNGGSVEITTDTENFPKGYGTANTFTEYTLDGYKFKIQQAYINGGKLQWRALNNNNGTGTIYNTQVYPQKITSVVLVYNSSDGNKNFTLNVGAEENPTSGTAITPEIDGSTYTFNCSAENADYFVLTNGTNAGYLDAITINYGVASVTNYISEPACCTKYDITIATGIENGSVTADLAKACEGVEVTLTPTANASYHFEAWDVYVTGSDPKQSVSVDANYKFNMPAGNVTVSATFAHDNCTNLVAPTLDAVTKDHHSATIAWNAVEGAVSYVLNVTEHDAAAIVTNESVTETSKALSSLKPSTQYDYSIMAVGDGEEKCADGNALLEGSFTTDEPATTGTFELFTGNLEEGDYVIVSTNALANVVNTNRLASQSVTITNNQIVNPDDAIIWHIAQSGEYWTVYNAAVEKYAAGTGTKNQAGLMATGVDDKALWTISGTATYEFVNKANAAGNVNCNLRYNSGNVENSRWACYSTQTGAALSLYKKVDASKPSTPTFLVAGGEYESAQTVHIACATEGATIYYTTDGTTPTSESAEFTEDLVISTTTTLQAIAIKGDASSNVATATYTFIVYQSVDEVWDAITSDGPTDARVWGYVSETNVNNYDNNFYISVDGSKEGNQLYAYRMNMNDNTVAVGDKVKLFGDLTIYNNVKEFKYTNTKPGQVISVEPKGALQSVAVSGTPTKTVYAANEDFEPAGLVVTGTYANGYAGVITEGITWDNDLTENKVTESTTVHVTATVGEVTSQAYDVAVTVATKTLVSIAATPATYTIYTGEALPQPTIMATYSEGDPEDVSAFATYDSENVFNTATIDNPDPQTITVSYTFGEETQTTTYTVSVKDYANDAENPYTVEQALYIITKAIGNANSERDIYVQGIVCQKSNPSSKTQTYYISDDGTTTTKLEIYKGKYLAGADFTEDNQVLVNDEVLVGGKVIYYNSNTPEFASGLSQLYSLSRTPNFSIANVTAFEVGAEDKAAVVTKDGEGEVTLAISSDETVVTIADNKLHAVAPGTATITANLAADGIYKATSTTFTVEVVPAQAHYTLTLKASGAVYQAIDAFENTSVWELLSDVTDPDIAGYNFKGWSATEAGEIITESTAGTLTEDKTLYAVYAKGNFTYVKITETAQITDGQYLIVYETGSVAFNGALETLDAAGNTINVAIENGVITGTYATTAAEFTINATAKTIQTKSGKYIGRSANSNGLDVSDNAIQHSQLAIDNDNFVAVSTSAHLCYNSASNQTRFRYFKSDSYSNQKAIQLYKRTDGEEGEEPISIPTVTVEEDEVVNISDVVTPGVPVSIVAENGATVNIDQTTIATNVTAKDGATINVNEETTATSITVDDESKINVTAPTTVNKVFSVAATMGAGKSGQLSGVEQVSLAQSVEAYFDITLGDNANPEHWHAIAVPFPVDAINGIYNAETGAKLQNEVDYAIMDYHGDIRATGAYGWKKYRSIMQPGVFYLMTVNGDVQTFRFKMYGTVLPTGDNLKFSLYEYAKSGSGQNTDAGWNGVANPTLEHGSIDKIVYVLNPSSYTYEDFDASSHNLVVGTPFFIQADADESNVVMEDTVPGHPYYAPRRASEKSVENIKVFFGNDEYKDKLTISANEEALNEYQIGKDLVKMTMTNTPKVAQIFGNAYNAQMSRIYAPMSNNKATYDLTLYAPEAGEYTIAAPAETEATIYLTKNGKVMWNLSMGECTLDLEKGNNDGYGLLLHKAPQVVTGIENADAMEAGVQKIVIDDHVFILRGEQMYDVTGKVVK